MGHKQVMNTSTTCQDDFGVPVRCKCVVTSNDSRVKIEDSIAARPLFESTTFFPFISSIQSRKLSC